MSFISLISLAENQFTKLEQSRGAVKTFRQPDAILKLVSLELIDYIAGVSRIFIFTSVKSCFIYIFGTQQE